MEQLFDEPQLTLAADERRFEAGRLQLAAGARDDADGAPQLERLDLSLQLVETGVLEDDRALRGAAGRLADEERSRICDRLDARGGVHQVAGDYPLPLRADRHRSL